MGGHAAPNIVEDGLIFLSDPANPRSYPGTGTNINDLINPLVSGSLSSTPTFDPSQGNGVFDFDGTDKITYNLGNALAGSTEMSISCWMNMDTLTLKAAFGMNKDNSFDSSDMYNFACNFYLNQIRFNIRNGGKPYAYFDGLTNPGTNVWFHYVGVFDGSQSTNATKNKVYINGNKRNMYFGNGNQPTSLPSFAEGDNFLVGLGENLTWYCDGQIGAIQIYNKALTAQEVKQNYNALKGRFSLT
tara:strand:+ start:714 stop:1445 length:732 start_codon:yes stop_codon:yes gene_type:complete